MNQEYINNPGDQLFILVAPLDWGLGHATRCIPIIQSLQKYRATVIVAAEGAVAELIRAEFPELEILPLDGYGIRYARRGGGFLWKLLSQLPKIQNAINQENRWLDKLASNRVIHGVIADNRLGLYHKRVPSLYITHQLFIETGITWLNRFVQNLHYKYINRFCACWVPDVEDRPNLAGKLSHPSRRPKVALQYLGILSRFQLQENRPCYDLLIILSGPEPQRSLLEEILIEQLRYHAWSVAFIRGLPGEKKAMPALQGVTFHNHLPAAELSAIMQQSKWVIARAGYSTIMDLAVLQKRAILVPTPGQGEQEYLAKYVHEKKMFFSVLQKDLILTDALEKASDFPFQSRIFSRGLHDEIVRQWLISLNADKASL